MAQEHDGGENQQYSKHDGEEYGVGVVGRCIRRRQFCGGNVLRMHRREQGGQLIVNPQARDPVPVGVWHEIPY